MGSVYGVRDRSVYRHEPTDPEYGRNPHILTWWTEAHDRIVGRLIERDRWVWDWAVTDEVLSITPEHVINQWVSEDPKCAEYAWSNVIMYFAKSRAETLGLADAIRAPKWKTCPLCQEGFVEDSLWVPMARIFGVDNITFCSPCLEEAIFGPGNPTLSRSEILDYVKDLAEAVKRPPPQTLSYGGPAYLSKFGSPQERINVIPLLKRKPTRERVKQLFGSWQNALVEAGVKPKAR